jgi:hypothetical protein
MEERTGASLGGRVVLILLTLYGLVTIAPDFLRVFDPLASFGLTVNADGRVYDVIGPFGSEENSPAWAAGVRAGDHLDLDAMRCLPIDTELCATALILWGGVNYVMPGREAAIVLEATKDRPAREIRFIAKPHDTNRLLQTILFFQQVAGVLVVLGAAWLVWTRPGPMTWGFFAYTLYFNPAQIFQSTAWLQQWPWALLAQGAASCVMQTAGYIGLLVFALRAPIDRAEGRWRRIEYALPVLALVFLLISGASLGSLLGFRSELAMQSSVLLGFAVSAAAVAILVGRRKDLSPRNYQRIRWVIWGCLIGLPAYLIAEMAMETSLLSGLAGGAQLEELAGAFYLVNGILCLFVVEAVRRESVVNVAIPLRRATALGLLLSVPTLLLHRQMEAIDHYFHMPEWAWLLVASALVYVLARAHEYATEVLDRLFDRKFRRAELHLRAVSETILHADTREDIERQLIEEPMRSLSLASAALFREQDGGFYRSVSAGWSAEDTNRLATDDPLLASRFQGDPYGVGRLTATAEQRAGLPADVARPTLAAPISTPRRCFAVALYSAHETGAALDHAERALIGELARSAEIAYAQVEGEMMRGRIAALERELARVSEPPGVGGAA